MRDRWLWLPLGLGAWVRLLYPLGSTFPLNDGGMFYVMVQDLTSNGYRLPAFTSYNAAGIPFAYPPAAFYLAAALSRVWPLLDVLRVLPPLLATLAMPVFYLLARDVLTDLLGEDRGRAAAWVALAAYALIPSSFQWQIMGGGLTRSLGYLASLTTLWLLWRFYARWQWRYLVGSTLGLAIAVGSHPELGWFTVFSLGLLFASARCSPRIARSAGYDRPGRRCLAADQSMVVDRPVAARTVAVPGRFQYRRARQCLGVALPGDELHRRTLADDLGRLGVLGIIACLRDRRFLLLAWLLLVYLLDPRKGMSLGSVPLAMMIGYGIETVLCQRFPGWAGKAALGAVLGYATVAALALAVMPLSSWAVLPAGEREAMAWVREHTPAESQFLVVSSSWLWARDQAGEWFPALAERSSLTTVQGREWVPGGRDYQEARRRFATLQACQDASCLASVGPHTHVYVSKTPVAIDAGIMRDLTLALRSSLQQSPHYSLVFSNASADVYELRQ